MRGSVKALLFCGALTTAGLAAPAAAATAPPTMDTSTFSCYNGACEVGPGNVGMPFATGLNVIGDGIAPSVEKYYGDDFKMTVISGTLPPGLGLSLPSTEWTVTGTPTQAGTYPFTVQFTPNGGGTSGAQQLVVAIGTSGSDRLVVTGTAYNGHQDRLYVDGYDVNISASYTVSATATGKVLIPAQPNSSAGRDGSLALGAFGNDPCGTTRSCNITVSDNLGSSVTVTLPPATY